MYCHDYDYVHDCDRDRAYVCDYDHACVIKHDYFCDLYYANDRPYDYASSRARVCDHVLLA